MIGRDPFDAAAIHDELYGLMRVRGYTGGFYLDALAAVDIALWDLAGRLRNEPVAALLGEVVRDTCPAYVSGLPRPTLTERTELAVEWMARGFGAVKFAAAVAHDGIVDEMFALRGKLGEAVDIAVDMHWAHEAGEAIALIRAMEPARPWFAEAPVRPEDIEAPGRRGALGRHAGRAGRGMAHGLGRPGRAWNAAPWQSCSPRWDNVGITQVHAHGCARRRAWMQRHPPCQHQRRRVPRRQPAGRGGRSRTCLRTSSSIRLCSKNNEWLDRPLICEAGRYRIPQGPGLGVAPKRRRGPLSCGRDNSNATKGGLKLMIKLARMTGRAALCAAAIGLVTGAVAVPASADTTLKFISWQVDESGFAKWWREIIAEFESTHPDVKIEFTKVARNEYADTMTTLFASGAPPEIVHLASFEYQSFAENGWLEDPRALGRTIGSRPVELGRSGEVRLERRDRPASCSSTSGS